MKLLEDTEKTKIVGDFYKETKEINVEYYRFWMEHTFLRWDFLLSWAFTIIPLFLWWKFRKKESTNRLLFAGMFVVWISSYLDFLGSSFNLWFYTGKALPTIPSFIPWDWSLLPVFAMTLLQLKPKLKPVYKALIFAILTSFIGEPVFIWLGLYHEVSWSHIYSFPIYFVLFLIAHKLSKVGNFEKIE